MHTLAIETTTEACSVALFEDEGTAPLAARHERIGRGHAERLVPMIAELPDRGRAGRILVSLGPGSFTGVRIGIATARALGIAWRAQVLGYPTLALVAAMAARGSGGEGAPGLLVCMNGGHGEWFVQPFAATGEPAGPCASLPPESAVREHDQPLVAGSRAGEFVALRGFGEAAEMLPDAALATSIAGSLLTERLAPIYGRAPDARLPA